MSNNAKFKVGDTVVRTKNIEDFYRGSEPSVISETSIGGWIAFDNYEGVGFWNPDYFELYQPVVQPEVKPTEQPKVDRKLRLTEMQKEAIQAGIKALYRQEESLKEQSYDPSLTYHIEICKYQQEVLRSMLREVNR